MSAEDMLFYTQKVLQILAVILGIFDLARALPAASFFVAFMQEASWVVGP
jgi:hypothetical protein